MSAYVNICLHMFAYVFRWWRILTFFRTPLLPFVHDQQPLAPDSVRKEQTLPLAFDEEPVYVLCTDFDKLKRKQ
jgi:hypothetical protein